ncbi:MAG: C25 family cysteine peptidase [Chloroflexi bacterium]|nr:C25 family cysteine peptidase [Chloroflexota bacterium]
MRFFLLFLLLFSTAACRRTDPTPAPLPISDNKLKIEVAEDGLYAIDLAAVQALGVQLENWSAAPLALTHNGQPIAHLIHEGQLLFYGRANDSIYTTTRAYLLEIGTEGVAMNTSAVSPQPSALSTQHSVLSTQHLEQNTLYVSNAHTAEHPDTWYWHTIHVEQMFETTFTLPESVAKGDGSGRLGLQFWGASHDPNVQDDHDLDVSLNGQFIQKIVWEGQVHHTAELDIPAGLLRAGENTLLLDNRPVGNTFIDISHLDWIEVNYQTAAEAHNDALAFTTSGGAISLAGFSAPPLVLNLANPDQPEVVGLATAAFDSTADTPYLAVAPAGYRQPAQLTGLRPTTLTAADNQADFLIITTEGLLAAVEPLAEARRTEGLATRVVDVAEIYDHFGGGHATPEAITHFLRHTAETWADPAPRYVLLVGRATYDYRNYLGQHPAQHLPALMIPVTHSGETVSDARMADLDGDYHPDMAIGRWPVDSSAAVSDLVQRTLAYEQAPLAGHALFAADGTSAEFTDLSDYLVTESAVGDKTAVNKLYGATQETVTAGWNEGVWLVSYVGHGSLNLWGKDNVFNADGVAGLQSNGTAPPIVLQFTCLTGFFAHPTEVSLSERMLTSPDGPVLLIAATSLTLSAYQRPFALSLLNHLQDPAFMRMGDVLQAAKLELPVADLGVREISDTFGLLGDPTAKIVRP